MADCQPDKDLEKVITAWPALQKNVKAAILVLVESTVQ
jgi:hypothetical protein